MGNHTQKKNAEIKGVFIHQNEIKGIVYKNKEGFYCTSKIGGLDIFPVLQEFPPPVQRLNIVCV